MKEDDHASNDAPERDDPAERLAVVGAPRGTVENVKDDTGERDGPADGSADTDHVMTRRAQLAGARGSRGA